MENEQKIAYEKAKEALKSLSEAWNACAEVFSNIYTDCNDYIDKAYPFGESFEVIEVNDWIETSLGRLDKLISGYKQLNNEPIPIECVKDEHEERMDFEPSFWWNNRRYHLCEFTRTHNNPWVSGEWPEFIHGFEAEQYHNPLYVELIGSDAVNVYEGL